MAKHIETTKRVYTPGEPVVLKINLDSNNTKSERQFTWTVVTVTDGETTDVVHSEAIKQPVGGLTEFTVVAPVTLDPGSYHVRLDRGRPDDVDPDMSPYDEESFAVAVDPGKPVRLVSTAGPGTVSRDVPTPSYHGFEAFLEELEDGEEASAAAMLRRLDHGEEFHELPSFEGFGRTSYRALKRVAKAYVGETRCESLLDLVPPGYLEERRAEAEKLTNVGWVAAPSVPCIELIWNYFQEEGMLVQSLNVILARFQNRRLGPDYDPLGRFDVTPLLPLRNLLWGWAEDELNRLTLRRRAAEYEYEYGLTLIGKAVPPTTTLVERRSGFLATFHQILHQALAYYKEADDLTVQADPFPLFQSLRDCHVVLSQGSHNQYGEMAVAARVEFLLMQHILAQPQMREFLGGRPMTPYPEPWMDRVDTMKSIQGWTDTSVMHFHDLATVGERLVLSIRLGNWASPSVGGPEAGAWADAFRSDIQRYVAAYRTATGVDLAQGPDATMPSTLLARRLRSQRQRA